VKPSAAALRLCHAVGLATKVRVGRWTAISTVIELLPVVDQANDDAVIAAAVAAGLVAVNSGPIAHSISLTAASLDACRSLADPERKNGFNAPYPSL
jgi:hypothetical protein